MTANTSYLQSAESDWSGGQPLQARRLGIHTRHGAVVFMRTDCHVCRSEGLSVRAGEPLCAVHAETCGELAYALDYAAANDDSVGIVDA